MAALSAAPLRSRAAASASTGVTVPSSMSASILAVVVRRHAVWSGHRDGSPSTAGPSSSMMRWISGSKAISM